ncbi:MAG TPA: RsmB/NOP family class I SAM-dependent RNA methyltransferase [Alphaproteobacteria bacterium]|nr:RsmB/NOP family class I SAM-dependent RNA methyltransferase [Alphaproteobacteria bacterium]
MTPAARVKSAIDILDILMPSAKPADRVLNEWARGNRYAGSKDRLAIFEMVYSVLRRRAEYSWIIGQDDARSLVLAELKCEEDCTLEQADALFTGDKYSAAALSEAERAAFSRDVPAGAMPQWVRGNFPQWLEGALQESLPDLLDEMRALSVRAPLDLRVNRLKGTREKALAALAEENISAAITPWSPDGLRITGRVRITGSAAFTRGLVEVQDEGSQLAALLVCAQPGQQVIDLCAGGGGKSLAIAAQMQNRGQIYALDAIPGRLKAMPERVSRAGVHNIQIIADAVPVLPELKGRAHRVVLDAPCSGTGAWRRNPDAKWRLTPEALTKHMAAQDSVLRQGADLVAPGGRLIYITCSLLACENRERIAAFLRDDARFTLIPAAALWAEGAGTPPPDFIAPGATDIVLTPLRSGTDGFYICALERRT